MRTPLHLAYRVFVASQLPLTYAADLGRAIHFDHSAVPNLDVFINTSRSNVKWPVLVPILSENFSHTGRDSQRSMSREMWGIGNTQS
jgi:hypothetical protein